MPKERNPLSSVLFQLQECIDAFDVLKEIDAIHKTMLTSGAGEKNLPISRHLIAPLVGIGRDSFCTRLAYLFDKRRDSHSLKKYFKGDAVDKLEQNQITKAAIKARHGNIAHMGKKYTKWPDVKDILNSGLRELLNSIKIGIMLSRHQ